MSYIPGKPVWFELATPDHDAAQRFYGEVFDWKTESVPMGPDGNYVMFKPTAGQPHSGLVELRGPHPHWVAYVSVEDVDAVAAAGAKRGGKVIMDAFDVPGVGRMAGVADPEGAVLMAFRAETADDPADPEAAASGTFCWIELMADDPAAATAWYQGVFGYDAAETMQMDQGPYTVLSRDGKQRAGLMGKPEAGIPSYWLPYVFVEDVDATVARAKANGGQSVMDPVDAPGVGRIGMLLDAQGAHLGLLGPAASDK